MQYKNKEQVTSDLVTLEAILTEIVSINESREDHPRELEMDRLEYQLASILKSICNAMYMLELTNFRYKVWSSLETMFDAIRSFRPHETD